MPHRNVNREGAEPNASEAERGADDGTSSSRSFLFRDEDDVLGDEMAGESGAGAVRDSSYLEVGAFRVVVPLDGRPKAARENLAGFETLDCPDRRALVVNR